MPQRQLNIALIPLDIKPLDSVANVEQALARIASLPSPADLVVLPEMFSTGFTPDPAEAIKNAESPDGYALTTLAEAARLHGAAICGGYSARLSDGRLYNQGFFINPDDQSTHFYNKRHLFRYGGEAHIYTPGDKPSPIIDFRGWHLRLSVCYDIRFPAWNRNRHNSYDILVVPANWAHSRYYAWRQLLIARAIENQCYVLGCNREGADTYGQYNRGDSLALDYWGKEIGQLHPDGTVTATLDGERLRRDRQRFDVWRDADNFELLL